MTITTEDNGSFKGMRARDRLLFDSALHRHDRGWPHSPPQDETETRSKSRWKTVGIFHFPQNGEEENQETEPGNGGSH